MEAAFTGRALHWVFKITKRAETLSFFTNVLGMKVLRHEEFKQKCEAACNGPYVNPWSKTMVGYGPEATHFAMELTYNYGITSYKMGNDFISITLKSREAIERAISLNYPFTKLDDVYVLEAPGGYKFHIINEPQPVDKDPIQKITVASSNLQRSIAFWNGVLGLQIQAQNDKSVSFAYSSEQTHLEYTYITGGVHHEDSFGRIAFSCPGAQLPVVERKIRETDNTVLRSLVTLETPGKADVTVVILSDPDSYEICYVDEEGFSELSKVDPKAENLLQISIAEDVSN